MAKKVSIKKPAVKKAATKKPAVKKASKKSAAGNAQEMHKGVMYPAFALINIKSNK